MKNKENIICQRCLKNEVLYFCYSCPKQFNILCSDCDTYIHSIIPYKSLHLREKIEFLNEDKNINNSQKTDEIIKELEDKNIHQEDIINKLNTRIEEKKKNIYQLIKQIKHLKREKQNYINELNYIKVEIEKYKTENEAIKEKLEENIKEINKLNNELKIFNEKLNKKELELEEIKYYYNNKISDITNEKKYLLNEIDKWNNNLIEQKDLNKKNKDENILLQNKIINFEKDNDENLKIISQLQKENKELIRRLNNSLRIK